MGIVSDVIVGRSRKSNWGGLRCYVGGARRQKYISYPVDDDAGFMCSGMAVSRLLRGYHVT